jgi:hypothetical protein
MGTGSGATGTGEEASGTARGAGVADEAATTGARVGPGCLVQASTRERTGRKVARARRIERKSTGVLPAQLRDRDHDQRRIRRNRQSSNSSAAYAYPGLRHGRHRDCFCAKGRPASKLRPKIVPRPAVAAEKPPKRAGSRYRPWAELLKRCFAVDVLACPRCGGRMRVVALVTEAASVRRFLRGLGESTDAPARAPARGPSYWRSRVLRRAAGEVSVA